MSTDPPRAPVKFYSDFLMILGSLIVCGFLVDQLINGYHVWSWFAWSGAGFVVIGARGDRTIYLLSGLALVLLSLAAVVADTVF